MPVLGMIDNQTVFDTAEYSTDFYLISIKCDRDILFCGIL